MSYALFSSTIKGMEFDGEGNVMDAFSLLTLEVGQPVHAQHVRVAQEVVRL
jgi:hypothetical protein